MISSKEFRLQRHMEIWKDQNKLIKRVIILTPIFAFLILTRVLIPFNENSQKYGDPIIKYKEEKATLEILKRLVGTLISVQATVNSRPWMKEKNKLIRKFQDINSGVLREDPQEVANATIQTIAGQVRNQIVNPLKTVFESDPAASEKLPGLSKRIVNLAGFIDNWEKEHINKRWYGTLTEKHRQMIELTLALNEKTRTFSALLKTEVDTSNKEIATGNEQIKATKTNADQANEDLEKVLAEFFPKWVKLIFSLQQMIQLYSVILLTVLLYVFWMIISLSRHYSYIADKININDQDKTDFSTSSIWTLSDKTQSAAILTSILYILFIFSVWILFESGLSLLNKWLKVVDNEKVFMTPVIFQPFKWIGRIVFLVTISAVLLNQRIKFFRRIST